eukprot:gnl/MRDRNA2_/MRDRNA2_115849_c0_seq1.p1 gnl/MRDRNA2_/MRDRNA2_115849_c0~~gnl/MRDRNA2_/MRDRNA2_115849_c0_seq1.p1  ORF type:complete len:402 (+),score=64.69 gnl/MRDRNA2_/MRDRNA2_115849_c0_seq1:55-1260(+)
MAPNVSDGQDEGLDDYTNELETRLSIKSNQVDQITRLYHALEARFVTLEQGLAEKEGQLDAEMERSEALRRDGLEWQKRFADIEKENNILRQALMERAAEVEAYSMYMEEGEHPMRSFGSPDISPEGPSLRALASKCQKMAQELIDAKQKTLLLEEQLRIRSRTDPFGQEVAPGEASAGATFASHALQPWMCVSAADRICATSRQPVSRSRDSPMSSSHHDSTQELSTSEFHLEEHNSRKTSLASDQTQTLRLPLPLAGMVNPATSSSVLEQAPNQSNSKVNSQEFKEESVRREWTDRNVLTWHAGNPTPVTPVTSNSTNTPSSTSNSTILPAHPASQGSAIPPSRIPGTPNRLGTHAPLSSVVFTTTRSTASSNSAQGTSSKSSPGISAPPPSTKSSTTR